MDNQNTQTVCTHLPEPCAHTYARLSEQCDELTTQQTVWYWTDCEPFYWTTDDAEATTAQEFGIYGETFSTQVPSDWGAEQIHTHIQTVCTHLPEPCAHTEPASEAGQL